jgi:hypothetical protein
VIFELIRAAFASVLTMALVTGVGRDTNWGRGSAENQVWHIDQEPPKISPF